MKIREESEHFEAETKIGAISPTFQNAFSWMKMYEL